MKIIEIDSRNRLLTDGQRMFIEITNVIPVAYVTASQSDQEMIAEYRWRLINDKLVTTVPSGSVEVRTTLDSMLFSMSRTQTLPHTNNNIFDYSRENLRLSPSKGKNQILINTGSALLLLPNAQTAIIDPWDVAKVEPYNWSCKVLRGQPTVMTKYSLGGRLHSVQLSRLLLDIQPNDARVVTHKNGDVYDYRRSNLNLRNRK